jgi:hypothetical protein
MKFETESNLWCIYLKQTLSLDNNFIENIAFVNCNIDFINSLLVPYADLVHRVMLTKPYVLSADNCNNGFNDSYQINNPKPPDCKFMEE